MSVRASNLGEESVALYDGTLGLRDLLIVWTLTISSMNSLYFLPFELTGMYIFLAISMCFRIRKLIYLYKIEVIPGNEQMAQNLLFGLDKSRVIHSHISKELIYFGLTISHSSRYFLCISRFLPNLILSGKFLYQKLMSMIFVLHYCFFHSFFM